MTNLKRYQTSFVPYRSYHYYVSSKCLLCGKNIMHNQYVKKNFSRIVHLECLGMKNHKTVNRSRMQDYIQIRTAQIKGKAQYKLV